MLIRPLAASRLMRYSLLSFVGPTAAATATGAGTGDNRSHVTVLADAPFRRGDVTISLRAAHGRRVHPAPEVEAAIDAVWAERLAASPGLFNGTKFRLHGLRVDVTGRPARTTTTLAMQWGLTDYKSYLGADCSTLVTRLRADGDADTDSAAFLSRKVGVSGIVETGDGRVALLQRSAHVGVYQDLADTPGGHPEPEDLAITAETLVGLDARDHDETTRVRRQTLERAAVERLFDSIADEVHEEINLPSVDLSDPLLLGVVLQAEAETPSFAFAMRTERTAEDVERLYRAGPKDKFESTRLQFLFSTALREPSWRSLLRFTPAAEGSLELWRAHRLKDQ